MGSSPSRSQALSGLSTQGLGLASAPAWGWRGPNRAPAVICFGAHPHTCAEGLYLLFGGVRNRQNKSTARSSPSLPAVRFFPSVP